MEFFISLSLRPWRVASVHCCVFAIYLFYKVNAILKIHAKVNESPFDAFALVFFLLQHEHMVVKELLEFLIGEINAELFKTVVLQGHINEMVKARGL